MSWIDSIYDALTSEVKGPDPFAAFAELGWQPQPKQAQAEELSQAADEMLFGGAAGGGKSDWLLHHAIAQMELYPGNRGVIFRRVMPSLERSILARARGVLNGRAAYNGQKHTFTFPNGSVLEFAHLQHAHTVHDYQGAEYGFIGFEELTEFLEEQFEYLRSRCRSTVPGVRPHIAATSNPGNVGHVWVKRRWISPRPEDLEPGQAMPEAYLPWRAASPDGGETPGPVRVFVPATVYDNPKLLEADPLYISRLKAMKDPGMRAALLEGDWDAIEKVPGALWTRTQLEETRVRSVPGDRVRTAVAVDPAVSSGPNADDTGISAVTRTKDGHLYVLADETCHLDADRRRGDDGELMDGWAMRAVRLAVRVGASEIVAEKNQGGELVRAAIRRAVEQALQEGVLDRPLHVRLVHSSQSKEERALPWSFLWGEPNPTAHIVGVLEELEEQMVTWVPGTRGFSPDRVDAMVLALAAVGAPAAQMRPDPEPLDEETRLRREAARRRRMRGGPVRRRAGR